MIVKLHEEKFYKTVYCINNIFSPRIYNISNNNKSLKIYNKTSSIVYDVER